MGFYHRRDLFVSRFIIKSHKYQIDVAERSAAKKLGFNSRWRLSHYALQMNLGYFSPIILGSYATQNRWAQSWYTAIFWVGITQMFWVGKKFT